MGVDFQDSDGADLDDIVKRQEKARHKMEVRRSYLGRLILKFTCGACKKRFGDAEDATWFPRKGQRFDPEVDYACPRGHDAEKVHVQIEAAQGERA